MRLSTNIWSSVNLKSIMVGSIIAMVIVAFAVTGFGGRLGKNFDSNTAASVGSQEISIRTLNDLMQQYERQSGESPDANKRKAHMQTAINQLIQSKLFIEEATRMGWLAADIEVANWIGNLPAFRDDKTKKYRHELYQRFLKSGQMTELELYQTGREAISQTKMQSLLMLPVRIPATLLQAEKELNSVNFELEYINLQPGEQTIKAKELSEAKAFIEDKANAKKLEETWEKNKSDFEHKAQIRLNGILISWKDAQRAQGDALKRTKDEAKTLAFEILARINKGESFLDIAGKQNDDTNAKAKDGDMGWLEETSIDPETYVVAAKLNSKNSLSGLIESPFGYRIVQWSAARAESKIPFDQAKFEIAKKLLFSEVRRKLSADIEGEVTKVIAEKNIEKLNPIMAKYELKWSKLSKSVTAKDKFIEGIGLADTLIPKLFTLKSPQDLLGEVIAISDKKLVLRLISRKTLPHSETAEQIQALNQSTFARNFQTEAERKLYEVYQRNKEIRINPALNNVE